jgi:hypothetical protein
MNIRVQGTMYIYPLKMKEKGLKGILIEKKLKYTSKNKKIYFLEHRPKC